MSTADFLTKIVDQKKKQNEGRRAFFDQLKDQLTKSTYNRYALFKKQISRPGINLIAEIKKASPSKGIIREDFDVDAIAKTYVKHQAAAISVLTEDKYFLGTPAYVKKVSELYEIPVLMKDFFIDEGQVYEAAANGASAILLIMAILSDEEVQRLQALAHRLDLDCLVEVHDAQELQRALACDAEIIGINNRNLHTFDVDTNTALSLIKDIPSDKVIVAESGLQTHQDIIDVQEAGANAVLIGETFMRAADIGLKVDEIMKG